MNISKKEAIDIIAQIMFSHLKQKEMRIKMTELEAGSGGGEGY